ncbi:hypothetical protein O206_18435 [Ochrobactrum sp. EGD-AQ16]|nr:hypothetical protein O206_18435 [Ochrobactrum sp. EGD-AQ16]
MPGARHVNGISYPEAAVARRPQDMTIKARQIAHLD